MSLMRNLLLAASQNRFLRERASRYKFVRRTVSRFMPGEELSDALAASAELAKSSLTTVLTKLGENVSDRAEADAVRQHYIEVLEKVRAAGLPAEISVKPTQLGLDLSADLCFDNLKQIVMRAPADSVVWIDMEQSPYVDPTLDLYRRAKQSFPNVGVCVQAYLYRTAKDLEALLLLRPAIRLVKGAYMEPAAIAYPKKKDVDENYFALAKTLLSEEARRLSVRAAFGTHDTVLIRRIADYAQSQGLGKDGFEYQMLFGIQRAEQLRLAREGWRSRVLVSYGTYWYPWFVRRLAERPANVWFVVRNIFAG